MGRCTADGNEGATIHRFSAISELWAPDLTRCESAGTDTDLDDETAEMLRDWQASVAARG